MTTSPNGRKFVESFEACSLIAYLDQGRVATLGWGHTLGVQMGDTCTQAQADAWLEEDLATAESAVTRMVKAPLTQSQFDALVDFTYNEGQGHLAESTVLKRLNLSEPPDYQGAANALLLWDMIGGVESPGLLRRRHAERALFLTPEA